MAISYDLIVVGGGPSGMAAAIRAKEKGVKDILIIEREEDLGGALNQCIHNGFGKEVIGKEVTGTELIHFFINKLDEYDIEYKLSTIVIDFNNEGIITYMNPKEGICFIKAKSIIFATGSREKYTGKIHLATKNYSGVYTLGTVHRLINLQGYLPGKEVVIMDSSDIAMIVARSLVVEGADVKAIVESSSEIKATQRNNRDIPKDFNIPILYNSEIKEVVGKERVSKVKILNKEINEYSEINCDGLVLSVAWRSEIDLLKKARIKIDDSTLTPITNGELMTSQNGVFVCGTLLNTSSLAKEAIETGFMAGDAADKYIKDYLESRFKISMAKMSN